MVPRRHGVLWGGELNHNAYLESGSGMGGGLKVGVLYSSVFRLKEV